MSHSTNPTEPSSGFDSHHPPEKKYIDDCVHCGFCLPPCPTYVLWGEEMDSPRGRIYMMKKAAQGEAPLDDRFRMHMDNCLGCMACMTACPSGVQYDKLIEPTRAQIERNLARTPGERLFRKLIFATFPHPERLRLLALPLRAYQKTGLQWIVCAERACCSGYRGVWPPWSLSCRSACERILKLPRRLLQPRRRGVASACSAVACSRSSSACECRDRARSGRGRMRGRHSSRTSPAAAR